MKNLIAQTQHNVGNTLNGIGPYSAPGSAAPGIFAGILSTIIGIMTLIAGIWFVFTLLIGAIQWISAGGNKASIEEARGKIFMGIIGLTITISAIFIADFIGSILGLDILNIAAYIVRLAP